MRQSLSWARYFDLWAPNIFFEPGSVAPSGNGRLAHHVSQLDERISALASTITLVPGDKAQLGAIRFEDWLRRTKAA
jgi:hypothetical protein